MRLSIARSLRLPLTGLTVVLAAIEFLTEAVQVVRSHHERWNGAGYPDGVRGEDIPIAARVFAVADVFDALTTDRPYRPASSLGVARAMIRGDAGSHSTPG
ncbi:MAG: HD-GYP domain-containing protein [Solirubrobacteraceae bacterium]